MRFDNRARAIDHLAEKSEHCMMNAVLRLAPYTDDQIRQAEADMTALESRNHKAGDRHTYGETPATQAEGPLLPLYLPPGHSRQTPSHHLRPALKDATTITLHQHQQLGGVQIITPTQLTADWDQVQADIEDDRLLISFC